MTAPPWGNSAEAIAVRVASLYRRGLMRSRRPAGMTKVRTLSRGESVCGEGASLAMAPLAVGSGEDIGSSVGMDGEFWEVRGSARSGTANALAEVQFLRRLRTGRTAH
jgi:hypothetical protein